MNFATIIGRTTGDIVVRTANGKPVTNFTLAVDTYKDHTDFINCVAWDKKATVLEQYTKKGDKLGITGRISTRTYEDKEGKKQYTVEVVVTDIEFLTPKRKEEKTSEAFEPTDEFVPF